MGYKLGLQGYLSPPLTEELSQHLFGVGVSVIKEFVRETYERYLSEGDTGSIVYYSVGYWEVDGVRVSHYLYDVMILRYHQNIIRVEIHFKPGSSDDCWIIGTLSGYTQDDFQTFLRSQDEWVQQIKQQNEQDEQLK